MGKVKDLDWGSSELIEQTSRVQSWYKALRGHRDIVRVIGGCSTVYTHNWNDGTFKISMCSKEEHGTCPYCDAATAGKLPGHSRKMRWATTLLHIHRVSKGSSEPQIIMRLLAWRFSEEKKNDLVEIHELVSGNKRTLNSVDLWFRLATNKEEDEKFQKMKITAADTNLLAEGGLKKAAKALLTKENLAAVRAEYFPTPETLQKWLEPPEEEATAFKPDEVENDAPSPDTAESWNADDPLAGIDLGED